MSEDEGSTSVAAEGDSAEGVQAAGARPRLTIGMPVYNGEKYLGAALRSLAAQTFREYELILCDNASTDRTREICLEHAARDPRIRYVRNATNVGVLANFDRVAQLASCELFMWAASDDLWEPVFIERMVDALRAHPDVALAYCDYDWVDDEGKAVARGKVRFMVERPSVLDRLVTFNARNTRVHNFLLYFLWRNSFLVYGMFRTDALRRVLPFEYVFSDVRHADNIFMLRFLARERVAVVDGLLFHYRKKNRASDESTASYQSPGQSEPKGSNREGEVERVLLPRIMSIISEAPLNGVESWLLSRVIPVLSSMRVVVAERRARQASAR